MRHPNPRNELGIAVARYAYVAIGLASRSARLSRNIQLLFISSPQDLPLHHLRKAKTEMSWSVGTF
jgi:hypothetical protein